MPWKSRAVSDFYGGFLSIHCARAPCRNQGSKPERWDYQHIPIWCLGSINLPVHFPVRYTALPVISSTYSTSLTCMVKHFEIQKSTFHIIDGKVETWILHALYAREAWHVSRSVGHQTDSLWGFKMGSLTFPCPSQPTNELKNISHQFHRTRSKDVTSGQAGFSVAC